MATAGFTIKVDNSGKVLKDLAKAKERALTMIGMIAENYAVYEIENNPRRVDTGRLKNSITYKVEGEKAVHVGTNVEYAPLAI
jgi:phage gpG-like protein